MLRRSWAVFPVMGLVLVSRLAFADALGTTDRFLFPEGGTKSWHLSSAVVGPKLAIQNIDGEEASVNSGRGPWDMSVAQYSELKPRPKPKPKPKPVPVPENWGVSDSLGFFALAFLAFGVLILLRVLRPLGAS
jgi:hypothetical protein